MNRRQLWRRPLVLVVCGLLLAVQPAPSPLSSLAAGCATPEAGAQCFAETGICLPLNEKFTVTLEGGQPYTVQYFEWARFEWHPDYAGTIHEVQLGQLGRRILGER